MSLLPHQSRVGKLQRGIVSFLVLLVALTPAATLVPQEARADTHPADEFVASIGGDLTGASNVLFALSKDVSQRLRGYNNACGLSSNPNFLNLYTNSKNGTPTENVRIIDCLTNVLRHGLYYSPLTGDQGKPEDGGLDVVDRYQASKPYFTGVHHLLDLLIDKKLYDDESTREKSKFFVAKDDGTMDFTEDGKAVWIKYLNQKASYNQNFTAVYMALFILQKANLKDAKGSQKNVTDSVGSNDPATAEVDVHKSVVQRRIALYADQAEDVIGTGGVFYKKWSKEKFPQYGCERDMSPDSTGGICHIGNMSLSKKWTSYVIDPLEEGENITYINTGFVWGGIPEAPKRIEYKPSGGQDTLRGLPSNSFQERLDSSSLPASTTIRDEMVDTRTTIQSFKAQYYDPYFNFNLETGEGGEFITPLAKAAKAAGLPMQGEANAIPVPGDITEGMGRCGRAPNLGITNLELNLLFPHTFCVMIINIQSFSMAMLNYSFNFLGASASIPALRQGDQSSIWGAELVTNAQDVIVSTDGSLGSAGRIIRNATTAVLGLLNFVIVFLLILLALVNILQININAYAIKKLLPGIIIGFLLAQFSVFFMRTTLEVTSVLTGDLLTNQLTCKQENKEGEEDEGLSGCKSAEDIKGVVETIGSYDGNPNAQLTDENGIVDTGKVWQQAVLNVFILIGAVMIFILAFLFLLRNLIFFILTPLSPIAIFGKFFQPLSGITSRWWKLFISWLFMPLVAAFWIWLAFVWMTAGSLPQGQGLTLSSPTFFQYLLTYIIALGCIFLAMKTPFTMAGEAKNLVDRWNKMGKSAFKATGVPALGKAGAELTELGKTAYSRQVTQRLRASSAGSWWRKNITEAEVNRKAALKYAEERGIRYHIAEKKSKQLGDIEADAAKKKSAVEEAINKRRTTAQADYEAKLKELEETYSSGGAQAQAMLERGRARLKEEHDKILAGLATELATEKRNIDTNFEVKKLNLLRGVREGAARDAIRKARQEIEAEKKRLKEEAKRNQAWADAVNSKNDPHP